MGDLNAQIGCDNGSVQHVMGKHGIGRNGRFNGNGERFIDFCNVHHLVIGGSIFQHKRIHKVTYVTPGGRYNTQIDYFSISQRFKGCLEDVRNRRGCDIGQKHDHFLVVAILRLRTAAVKKDLNKRPATYFTQQLKLTAKCQQFLSNVR